MEFQPIEFVKSLVYMGKGLVGIFLVIGIIIGVTALLNKLTSPKKKTTIPIEIIKYVYEK